MLQFYAMLEVHQESGRLIWMTGPCRVEASYRDLSSAVKLDYRRMMRGKRVIELPLVLADDFTIPELYYQVDSFFGPRGTLRRFPRVLHEILRHTILPSAALGGNELYWPSLEVLKAVLTGMEVNLLDLLVT